jgi:hypothetical protein
MMTITDTKPAPGTPFQLEEEVEFHVGQIWGRVRLYRVFRISENTNSFGLRGVWIMRRNGEAWELGMSHLNLEKVRKGAIMKVAQMHLEGAKPDLSSWGEIPSYKGIAPPEVVAEVWKGATIDDVIGWPNDQTRV